MNQFLLISPKTQSVPDSGPSPMNTPENLDGGFETNQIELEWEAGSNASVLNLVAGIPADLQNDEAEGSFISITWSAA